MPSPNQFLPFGFDAKNVAAQNVASRGAAEMVKNVSKNTKKAIRLLIVSSIKEGIPPIEIARQVATMVGMNERQIAAARNFRARLIDQGLIASKVKARTDRYVKKKIRERAMNIARTETMTALNRGVAESYAQAQQQGLLDEKAKVQIIVTADDRTCFICDGQDGKIVGVREFGLHPPFHNMCRCTIGAVDPSFQNKLRQAVGLPPKHRMASAVSSGRGARGGLSHFDITAAKAREAALKKQGFTIDPTMLRQIGHDTRLAKKVGLSAKQATEIQKSVQIYETILQEVEHAARQLKKAGARWNNVKIKLVSAQNRSSFAAVGDQSTIFINTNNPAWRSVTRYKQALKHDKASKWISVDTQGSTVVHEMGHIKHLKSIKAPNFDHHTMKPFTNWKSIEGNVVQMKKTARTVSKYGATEPAEFVAETFAGLVNGKKYSKAVMDLYNKLGGPSVKPTKKVAKAATKLKPLKITKKTGPRLDEFDLISGKNLEKMAKLVKEGRSQKEIAAFMHADPKAVKSVTRVLEQARKKSTLKFKIGDAPPIQRDLIEKMTAEGVSVAKIKKATGNKMWQIVEHLNSKGIKPIKPPSLAVLEKAKGAPLRLKNLPKTKKKPPVPKTASAKTVSQVKTQVKIIDVAEDNLARIEELHKAGKTVSAIKKQTKIPSWKIVEHLQSKGIKPLKPPPLAAMEKAKGAPLNITKANKSVINAVSKPQIPKGIDPYDVDGIISDYVESGLDIKQLSIEWNYAVKDIKTLLINHPETANLPQVKEMAFAVPKKPKLIKGKYQPIKEYDNEFIINSLGDMTIPEIADDLGYTVDDIIYFLKTDKMAQSAFQEKHILDDIIAAAEHKQLKSKRIPGGEVVKKVDEFGFSTRHTRGLDVEDLNRLEDDFKTQRFTANGKQRLEQYTANSTTTNAFLRGPYQGEAAWAAQRRAYSKGSKHVYNYRSDPIWKMDPLLTEAEVIAKRRKLTEELLEQMNTLRPLNEPVTSYIGINKSPFSTNTPEIGTVIEWEGMRSTSLSPTLSRSFGGTMFEVRSTKGIYLESITKYRGEKEFLLNHGSRFKLVGIKNVELANGDTARVFQMVEM